MIGVELRVPTARAGPIQIQTIKAVDLLGLSAAVHLHGGLLVAVVAGNVKGTGSNARHLRHRGPRVAAAGDFLQQRLVKRR